MKEMSDSYLEKYSAWSRLPAEYFVRIMKGKYPRLNLSDWYTTGDKVLDAACGDGRHFSYLLNMGFNVYGYEVNDNIITVAKEKINASYSYKIGDKIKKGTSKRIPFPNAFFQGIISWNQLYYLEEKDDFQLHLEEIRRVSTRNTWFVASFPMPSCFIYDKAIHIDENVIKVQDDYFNCRNNTLMWKFKSKEHVWNVFSPLMHELVIGEQVDDCFGLNYHWYLVAGKFR